MIYLLSTVRAETPFLSDDGKRKKFKRKHGRMKKEWFFDCYCNQQFAALVEDGKFVEFVAEKKQDGALVGNIYKGRVTNVLSGMNAAFIQCGLARNCYLSTEETYTDYSKYDGTGKKPDPYLSNLKVGDELVVQITKPPRGTKGAKVTTNLSFVGKRMIYLPNTDFMGISRKITDEAQRESLLKEAEKMRNQKGTDGFIIRTQAPLATTKQLKSEVKYLKKVYEHTMQAAATAQVGELLYSDDALPERVIRDSVGEELTAIHVGNETLYKELLKLIKLSGDIPERKLVLYTGAKSMFREYGITPLLPQVTMPTVPLESGGYLVIEPTEALTVIDVNSGGCIGDKNLEDTVYKVNLEAANEIARQVRLRNIGGIIVVDFIDMQGEAHKLSVNEALADALSKDKAKCNVLPMSELCLTQFTRKRLGNELSEYLVKPCPYCEGNGYVADDLIVFTNVRDELLECFANGYTAAVVHANEKVCKRMLETGAFTQEINGRWKDKRIYLIPHKTYREDVFNVRGETGDVLTLPDTAQLLY